MINWISACSPDIQRIGYDTSTSKMYIDFKDSDHSYVYCGVSENLYQQFASASSVGRFYDQYIKGQYECCE